MSNKSISIIIPVYNGVTAMEECISSIAEQSHKNIEILLLDDGSHKEAAEKLDEIYEQFRRRFEEENSGMEIKCYHLSHRGVSAVRNYGLMEAGGEYLMYMDADDRLYDSYVVEKFLRVMESDESCDIVVGNYVREISGKLVETTSHNCFSKLSQDSLEYRFAGFFSAGHLAYVWGKMFRKFSLLKWGIPSYDISYGEDKLFSFGCYLMGAKYAFLEDNTYIYVQNFASQSYKFRKDYEKGWMQIARETEQLMKIQCGRDFDTSDLITFTLLFAVFFDGKMVYEHDHSRESLKDLILFYGQNTWAREYMNLALKRSIKKKIPSRVYRIGIPCFTALIKYRHFGLISCMIRFIVNLKVDQRIKNL